MSESLRARPHGGRRAADLLGSPPKAVYDVIMDAPDLDHGDGTPPPAKDEGEGDRRPDPDWRVIGALSFLMGFGAVTAVRSAILLVRLLR